MRLSLVVAAVIFPTVAGAASVISFDMPKANFTCGAGIASNGLVVGWGSDQAGSPPQMPFLYINGHFSAPNSTPPNTSYFSSVNKYGTLVGANCNFPDLCEYYVIKKDGVHSVVLPGSTATTNVVYTVNKITDSGTILGMESPTSQVYAAFLLTRQKKLTVLPANSSYGPNSLSSDGTWVVGGNWIYHDGTLSPFSIPGATATYVNPAAVDNEGRVSGTVYPASGRAGAYGFYRLKDGHYRSFTVPGATSTYVNDMNEAGQITGCYDDAIGTHGFVAKP